MSEHAEVGDGDPLDICVLSERPIDRAEVILNARVIGGLHMIDRGEADDKIISVLNNDQYYESVTELFDLPEVLIERLRHYFSTYKLTPGEESDDIFVQTVYDRERAMKVVNASMKDYHDMFGE
jgi:inorganic pyrophosphatase